MKSHVLLKLSTKIKRKMPDSVVKVHDKETLLDRISDQLDYLETLRNKIIASILHLNDEQTKKNIEVIHLCPIDYLNEMYFRISETKINLELLRELIK